MLHFYVFGCEAYVSLSSEVCTNKLALYSELMIFIRYKDNGYCFICYTQGNIIFCSTYTIFDKKLFPKYTNSHIKEHKLYDKLLDKISPETELSASSPSKKDRPTLIPILHISIPLIQNNLPTYSPLPSLSYKPPSLTSATESKKPTIEIEEDDNVDSDVEIQLLSSQQPLKSALQTPQEGLELRKSKHQTQIPFRKENIYGEYEYPTNILQNSLWQPRRRFPNPNIAHDIHKNACQKL